MPFTVRTVVTTVVIILLGTFLLIIGVGVVVRRIGVVGPVVGVPGVVPVVVPSIPTLLKTPFLSATTVTSRIRTVNINMTLATATIILEFRPTPPSSATHLLVVKVYGLVCKN